MSHLKKMSLWAGATVIAGTGLKDVLVSTLLVVGAPATTAGFVYEVLQLRQAQLKREADDRNGVAASQAAPNPYEIAPPPQGETGLSIDGSGSGAMDLPHRLASMLRAREHFLDLYGGDAEAVAPVYQGVVKAMLAADDKLLAQVGAGDNAAPPTPALEADIAHLRDLHRDLAKLAAPKVADNAAPTAVER